MADALTYTTLDGQTLFLGHLTAEESAFFDRCYHLYRRGNARHDFTQLANLVAGRENPLVAAAGGRITAAVWEHPLFQAVRDLEDRLGIRVGEVEAAPEDEVDRDPLEDTWIPSTEAAARKGVTLKGLHKAIHRGDVVARPSPAGRRRVLVSERSLLHWRPSPMRQAAGRRRSTMARSRTAHVQR